LTLLIVIYISGVLKDDTPIDLCVEEDLNDNLYKVINESQERDTEKSIDLKFIWSLPTVKFGCTSILISNIVCTYLDPIFATKMLDMDIYADKAGYIYVFLLGSYSLFGFFGGFLQNIASKQTLIISGFVIGFIGFCSIAHHVVFGTNYIILIILGLFLNGFSVVGGNMFATLFTKAELMEACEKAGISKKEAGGYFGGLKGSMNLIGSFIGPLLSPNIYMMVGFDYACITMGTIQILFVTFFIYTIKMTEMKAIKEYNSEADSIEIKSFTMRET